MEIKMDPSTSICDDSDKENQEGQDDVFESKEVVGSSVKGSPKHTYTREELVELGELPLSKKRPEHLSIDFQNTDGLWDPELWHRSADRERRLSLTENDVEVHHPHRKFIDPKERLKDESRDGIVLSPQRKSFVTGCHVIQGGNSQALSRSRDLCESDNHEASDRERREIPQRRIGSGRLTIDRDRYEDRRDDRRFDEHRGGHDDRREDWRRDNRNHDDRHRREEWTDYNGHNRHNDRIRRRSNQHISESEPEWFTAGPNSQSDTIELRGFNEHREDEQKILKGEISRDDSSTDSPVVNEPPPAPSPKSDTTSTTSERSAKVAPSPGADFDINELFNMDISGIRGGPSPVEGQSATCGSRFSRWFSNRTSETASGLPSSLVNMDYDPIEDLLATQPRRSMSMIDDTNRSDMFGVGAGSSQNKTSHQLANTQAMISAIMNQSVAKMPPSVNEPAHSPSQQAMEANLKAMLLANHNPVAMENRPPVGVPSNRFKTVSELEAGLPDANIGPSPAMTQHRMPEQAKPGDMSAFNKLVGMMKMSGSLPDSKRESPNMDLLAAKFEQQQKQLLQQQLQAKLLQHQETMARQNPTIITKPASPVPPMIVQSNISQTTPRMVSPNPIMQQQHLLGQPSTPRAPSPIMFGQQPPLHLNAPSPVHPGSHGGSSQNLSVNSLTVNSGSHSPVLARVPSPQELVYHTQAIMQNALIKKQLEDQKERFIKKQQRDRSPCDAGQVVVPQAIMAQSGIALSVPQSVGNHLQGQNSGTSSLPTGPTKTTTAFTPTSVIKKMAVERSNSKDKLKTNAMNAENVDDGLSETPAASDPSRVMAVPPMPQQSDMRVRRALVGSGSMKAAQQNQPITGVPIPSSQQKSITGRNLVGKQMYQGPGGLTPMPTAIPRLNTPMQEKNQAKSPLIGRKGPQPMGYNMSMNLMGHPPRHSMSGNHMLHLQALQQQPNAARVAPMNHPALNQMNHLPPHLPGHMDPRLRGYYPPMPGPRLPVPGLGVHRSVSPQPLLAAGGPRSPNLGDNDLAKWFGMDMLKQQLPNMPSLPAQGQRVLTVDELERRQQVVS